MQGGVEARFHHRVDVIVEVVLGAVLHHGVVVVVDVVLHHVVDVVVELGVVVHHVVHAWRVMVGVEMLDVGHVANACGAIVGVELHMVLHIFGACGAITLIVLHVILRRFILTIHVSLYDWCIYMVEGKLPKVSKLANQNRKGVSSRGTTDMYAHTQNKTLYGVRYGCGKPNGRTKRKVYCQKWVRSKSHKSKAVITKGIHKVEHTRGTKWG